MKSAVAATLLLLAALPAMSQTYGTPSPSAPAVAVPGEKEFYVATVHLDGLANINGDPGHGAEPYPAMALPAGGGLIRGMPDAKGNWSMRAFLFHPAQVVVHQGDRVALHFVGVHGPSHTIALDGQEQRVTLKRGEMKTIRFVADRPGTVFYRSVDRQPSMQGSVVVLAK